MTLRRRVSIAAIAAVLLLAGCAEVHGSASAPAGTTPLSTARAPVAQRAAASAAFDTPGPTTADPYMVDVQPNASLDFTNDEVGWWVRGQGLVVSRLGRYWLPLEAFGSWAGSTLERTIDGGRSWKPVTLPADDPLWGVDFLDANDGFAIGEQHLFRTEDGGRTWAAVSEPEDPVVRVEWLAPGRALGLTTTGTLVRTYDSAASWAPVSAPAASPRRAFSPVRWFWRRHRDDTNCSAAPTAVRPFHSCHRSASWPESMTCRAAAPSQQNP